MCLVFVLENIGRVLVGAFKPLPTENSPPGAVGSIVFFLMVCGVLVATLHPNPRCAHAALHGSARSAAQASERSLKME